MARILSISGARTRSWTTSTRNQSSWKEERGGPMLLLCLLVAQTYTVQSGATTVCRILRPEHVCHTHSSHLNLPGIDSAGRCDVRFLASKQCPTTASCRGPAKAKQFCNEGFPSWAVEHGRPWFSLVLIIYQWNPSTFLTYESP